MSTWLTTPPPVNDSTPSNGLKAPVVGDTEISIRKQLKAIKGKEKRKHFIPVTKNPFLRPADLYIRLVFKEIWRYLEFVGRTWYNLFTQTFRDLFTTPSEDAQGLGEWFSHTFFAIGGIVVLPFALFLCLFARLPLLTRFYYTWSSLFGGNLGLVNSGNPNLFNELTWRQAEKAKTSLSSKSFDTAGNNRSSRVFDYDVAKMLLQIAAVIYEHENDAIRESASFRTPGEVYRYLVGKPHVKEKKRKEKSDRDAAIVRFCDTFRIDYYPVSELNNDSSAFCGLFWDPRSNWIIVAFKGTGPIEFGEWLTDLDATMVECKNLRHPVEEPKPYIEGFRWLHRGFKNRVFPDEGDFADAEKDKRPYNTISKSVKALSDHLAKSQPAGTKINIWFTGHSLGCATASLVYSRFLMNETDDHKEMGKGSQLRDAYLFAAPILCDPCSAMVFNTKMDAEVDLGRPKTMWRITSNNDIVATGLPERGDPIVTALTRKVTDKKIDAKSYYGPTHSCDECKNPNNFNFAHLGTEIILYDSPHPSDVAGGHVTHGAKVKIHSNFGPADIREQRGKRMASWSAVYRERVGIVLQKIPLVGRVVAHCTIYYWDQLDRAATKECDWVVS